ncbi:hypothetical protein [Streptomyces griseus]|uniref:hypothetical protein n=1 Tax=Streptomyces griseus TaxID=1911 RepID=UPI00378A18B2
MTDTVTRRPLGPVADCAPTSSLPLPLDIEEADRAADEALGLKLGTTTRQEIDGYTLQLKGQVALFAEVLRINGGIEARGSALEAQQLLVSGPAEGILVFNAWNYVRDLARLLRRLVTEYREQLVHDSPALPTRTPLASLDKLTKSRQTYLVPSGLAPEHRPLPTAPDPDRP